MSAPARFSAGAALGAAGLAGVAAVGGSGWWVLLAPAGVALLAAGLRRPDRRLVTLGGASLACAAFVTGLAGGGPARLVVAVAAAFVAWDLGEHAITLGEQLGRRAATRRLEFLHAGATVGVATAAAGAAYVVFALSGGGRPVDALVLLLVGAMALLAALRWY